MRGKPQRGTVTVRYDDGTEHTVQGIVQVVKVETKGDVEFSNNTRKEYPVKYESIGVVVQDIPWEVVEGRLKKVVKPSGPVIFS